MSATDSIFEWDLARFTTKVGAMDREHEGLIKIMNQLYKENNSGTDKAQLLKTATLLATKTTEHFAHEERYFSTLSKYEGAGSHKLIHQKLLSQFGEHLEKFKKDPSGKFNEEFFRFLKVWLQAHICGIDRKYGELS